MADKAWKAHERRVSKRFGTKRSGPGQSTTTTNSDTKHETLYIECKHRKRHTVQTLYNEVKGKAKLEGKVPLLALHSKGQRGCLLVVHSEDFEAFLKAYKPDCQDDGRWLDSHD